MFDYFVTFLCVLCGSISQIQTVDLNDEALRASFRQAIGEISQLKTQLGNIIEAQIGMQAQIVTLTTTNAQLQHDKRMLKEKTDALQEANHMLEQRLTGIEEYNRHVTVKLENVQTHLKTLQIQDDTIAQDNLINTKLQYKSNKINPILDDKKLQNSYTSPIAMAPDNANQVTTTERESSHRKRLLIPGETVSPQNQPVAFTAILTQDTLLGPRQTIEYKKILTNLGNAYDSRHGHFTAPVKGLYIIAATSCSLDNNVLRTEIVKNGVQMVAMYGVDFDMGGHTIMVVLEQNDMVWVRHFNEYQQTIHASIDHLYSSFSGALLREL